MSDSTREVHIVRAVQTGRVEGSRTVRIWFAAVPRREAVAAVQGVLSDGWAVELSGDHVPEVLARQMGLTAGEVREFTA